MKAKQTIFVYTHKGCPGGDRAISYFQQSGIPVLIKDIVNDPDAMVEFRKHGCFATPVVIIDGIKLVGFDEEEVERLLRQKHES